MDAPHCPSLWLPPSLLSASWREPGVATEDRQPDKGLAGDVGWDGPHVVLAPWLAAPGGRRSYGGRVEGSPCFLGGQGFVYAVPCLGASTWPLLCPSLGAALLQGRAAETSLSVGSRRTCRNEVQCLCCWEEAAGPLALAPVPTVCGLGVAGTKVQLTRRGLGR